MDLLLDLAERHPVMVPDGGCRDILQLARLVARLRPTKSGDSFEVLYWSLWKNRWTSTGPFGRTVLSLDDALLFIASEDIFCVMT